jgi:phosphoglycerate dehydrogenase-like enzyme
VSEPCPQEHALRKLPNVSITLHYSGGHAGYVDTVLDVFVGNIRALPIAQIVAMYAGQ